MDLILIPSGKEKKKEFNNYLSSVYYNNIYNNDFDFSQVLYMVL